jgi:hypothetical protein
MSKNKDKRNDQQQHPQVKQDGSSQNPLNCDTRIHGAIEIHQPPSLVAQHKAERDEDKTDRNKNYVVSVATFWAVAIYGVLTFLLVVVGFCNIRIARDAFNASSRPYIGVSDTPGWHLRVDEKGGKIQSQIRTPETIDFSFNPQIKNFGTVPGRETSISWKVFFDGREQPFIAKISDKPSTVFPGEIRGLYGEIGPNNYTPIMNGVETFEFEVTVDYKGPSGHYNECSKYHYEPMMNKFFHLGACP